jgi:hypothetical protein
LVGEFTSQMKRSFVEQLIDSKTPLPFTLTQSGDFGSFTFFSCGSTSPFSEHHAYAESFVFSFTPLVQKSAVNSFQELHCCCFYKKSFKPVMAFSSFLYCILISSLSGLEMQFLNLVLSLRETRSSFRIMQLLNASSKFSFDL